MIFTPLWQRSEYVSSVNIRDWYITYHGDLLHNILINILTCIAVYALWKRRRHTRVITNNQHVWHKNVCRIILIGSVSCILALPWRMRVHRVVDIVIPQTIVQFVSDVSLSMAATDIPPSRFDAAKTLMQDLTNALSGYPVGVIHYAKVPFVRSPLSTSTKAIVHKIEHTRLRDFPPLEEFLGTNIGDALLVSIDHIVSYNQRNNTYTDGVIVLISDGDSNTGADMSRVVDFATQRSIPIHVVAVGNSPVALGETWPYKLPDGTWVVNDEPAKLITDETARIANMTSGSLYYLKEFDDIPHIVDALARDIRRGESVRREEYQYNVQRIIGVLLAFFLFCLVFHRIYNVLYVLWSHKRMTIAKK